MAKRDGDATETSLADVVRAIQALGVGQDQTNASLAQTNASLAQTNASLAQTNERITHGFAAVRLEQTRTNERLAETNERITLGFAAVHEEQARTNERLDQTNARLDSVVTEQRTTNKQVATMARRQAQHDERLRKLESKGGKGRNGH